MDCISGAWAACLFKWATREPRVVLLLHSANVRVNEVRLLSLGALRLLRSSRFALTQPDACGAGESLGDVEIGSSGVREKIFKISKTPSLTAAKATESICFPRHKVCSLQRFQRMRIEEKGHNARFSTIVKIQVL